MALRGQLSGRKLADLIRLREIVDRIATSRYVSEEALRKLQERFGVGPDIVSWGDYFQTELASLYHGLNDTEFSGIIDTVRFDLIAAHKVFLGKPPEFLSSVEAEGLAVYGKDRNDWTPADEESAHLYILMQYFRELGLNQARLGAEDEEWFNGFVSQERRHAAG